MMRGKKKSLVFGETDLVKNLTARDSNVTAVGMMDVVPPQQKKTVFSRQTERDCWLVWTNNKYGKVLLVLGRVSHLQTNFFSADPKQLRGLIVLQYLYSFCQIFSDLSPLRLVTPKMVAKSQEIPPNNGRNIQV